MKRLFCVALAVVLILALMTACASNKTEDAGTKAPDSPASGTPTQQNGTPESQSEKPDTKPDNSATPAPEDTESPPERAAAGVRIGFITQEYIGENVAEIPYIEYDGERSEAIESINRSLNQGLQWVYEDFMDTADEDRDWIVIKSYPFTTDQFLQVVVTTSVFPNYGTDGDLFSINYDIAQDEWLTIDDAYAMEATDYDTLLHEVRQHFVPEVPGQLIEEVKVAGFLIEDGPNGLFAQFLLEITANSDDSDPLKAFYSYTPRYNSFHGLSAFCLFDPYSMDQMDPPLSYQINAEH